MLLGFIFALGVGAAVVMPAWAAIVPELVPAEQLSVGHCAQQHRHQRFARDRTRDRGRARGRHRGMARVRAQRAVVHRNTRGAAAVATRAPQECVARGAIPERHSGWTALHPPHARAPGRANPRHRIFSVRQRDLVVVPADRSKRARTRSRDLWAVADLYRHRRGWRRDAAAPRTGEGLARCARCRREHSLRVGRAAARTRAEPSPARDRHARHRHRVDFDPFRASSIRPADIAGLGSRARTGRIRDCVHGRNGTRQHPLGTRSRAGSVSRPRSRSRRSAWPSRSR